MSGDLIAKEVVQIGPRTIRVGDIWFYDGQGLDEDDAPAYYRITCIHVDKELPNEPKYWFITGQNINDENENEIDDLTVACLKNNCWTKHKSARSPCAECEKEAAPDDYLCGPCRASA